MDKPYGVVVRSPDGASVAVGAVNGQLAVNSVAYRKYREVVTAENYLLSPI
jgi:hypothetical protein